MFGPAEDNLFSGSDGLTEKVSAEEHSRLQQTAFSADHRDLTFDSSVTSASDVNNLPPMLTPSWPATLSETRNTFSSPQVFHRNSYSFVGSTSTPASSVDPSVLHVPGLGAAGGAYVFGGSIGEETNCYGQVIYPKSFIDQLEDYKLGSFKSSLLSSEVPKPWLEKRNWRDKLPLWITRGAVFVGIVGGILNCYFSYIGVLLVDQPLCLILQDDFESFSVDTPGAIWQRDVELGGFQREEFEMTTASHNNSFVADGMLFIVPGLTELSIPGGINSIFDGHVFNLTGCTNTLDYDACGAVSNKSLGTVINPVMSARISTKDSFSIRYGRVEIKAKLPTGDWLWPEFRMLPLHEMYGPWPLSGEINIMQSRGNSLNYPAGGSNVVHGSLNWGPVSWLNAVAKTFGYWNERHSSFSSGFHTYVLEWTPRFMRTYVDSRLHSTFEIRFDVPFFKRGDFPQVVHNGSQTIDLENPWEGRPNSAPFDQPFYLVLDLAVGGTSGWFPDGVGGKPWFDHSSSAMRDFAAAQTTWYDTWAVFPDNALIVDYVKVWQLC